MHDLRAISRQFNLLGDYCGGELVGSGHIHDTYAISCNQGGTTVRYILQRINQNVFRQPVPLMENVERITSHIRAKLETHESNDLSRRTLILVSSRQGKSFYFDEDGSYWRVYVYIENALTRDVAQTPAEAAEAAEAFGGFQKMMCDLPGPRLFETIPNFHNTPARHAALVKAVDEDAMNRAALARPEIEYAMRQQTITRVLLDLCARGEIPERVTHNDTKINNVMMDAESGKGICVIDLDTAMPGLALYDFGDMVRTTTSPADEDERDLSKVQIRMPMFEALARGYLKAAGDFLTSAEKQYLPFSGRLITFEIGMRFLTDFLQGDTYFKIHRENHNLERCPAQFRLAESIREHEDEMARLVDRIA